MQDERGGLRFAALVFVGIAAFMAVMTFLASWQFNTVAQTIARSDAPSLDWTQVWLVPLTLGGGTVVVLAVAVGFWRAASNAVSGQPYPGSTAYQPSTSYQPVARNAAGRLDPNAMVAIRTHIANDRMIPAIKLYREATGVGLKEARDAVMLIKAEM